MQRTTGQDTSTLADLGDWPRIEIGSHNVVRHAYENVLNASARLASFATCGPTETDGPITERQEVLAADDLVTFAINARRLIENTASKKRFRHVTVRQNPKVDVLIHHKQMHIVRSILQRELRISKHSIYEVLATYGTHDTEKFNKYFTPLVLITSDQNQVISFDIKELIEVFQIKILTPILNLCAEHNLFLDDTC